MSRAMIHKIESTSYTTHERTCMRVLQYCSCTVFPYMPWTWTDYPANERPDKILEYYWNRTVERGTQTAAVTPTVYCVQYITPHPPGSIFYGRYVHSSWNSWNSWNSVGASKVGVGNIPLRAFRSRIARYWHCWHPLGCRAIELGRPPQGCLIHTVVVDIDSRNYQICDSSESPPVFETTGRS